ncbi:hypothetical protein CCMSSC00406_0001579 [Pleurotus cornucopiae]|uniref:Uncharacterized protein n=1 Tax=Pleurotus cornucopiae TaxID=5321 RepID=A0ACB7IN67_PLECO|nr:hypothetical protein CCMSSC00406_0001579 [Pleurotus cornucopiae]
MVPAAVLEKIIATWISHLRLVLMLGSSSRALPRTMEPRVIISAALGPPSHPHTPRAYAQTVALAICVHAANASNVVETASASEPFTNPIHLSLYLQIKFLAQHPRIKSSYLRPASQHQAPGISSEAIIIQSGWAPSHAMCGFPTACPGRYCEDTNSFLVPMPTDLGFIYVVVEHLRFCGFPCFLPQCFGKHERHIAQSLPTILEICFLR